MTDQHACVASAIKRLKQYTYRPVVLTDDEVAALLAAQKAEAKRISFLIDLLNRAREYVPDNTWLAEQIDSETTHSDGSSPIPPCGLHNDPACPWCGDEPEQFDGDERGHSAPDYLWTILLILFIFFLLDRLGVLR